MNRSDPESPQARRVVGAAVAPVPLVASVAVAVAAALAVAFAASLPTSAHAWPAAEPALAVGPPSRELPFDAARQARLTAASAAFAELRAAESAVDGAAAPWFVRWDELLRRPRSLFAPAVPWPAADAVDEARAFADRHAALFGVPARDLVLHSDSTHLGLRYVDFSQHYRGVPVEGAALEFRLRIGEHVADAATVALEDRVDLLSLVRSRLVPVGDLTVIPEVSAAEALAVAVDDWAPAPLTVIEPGALVILPFAPSTPTRASGPAPRLAWKSELFVPSGPHHVTSYVDALTGELLHRWDDVRSELDGTIQVEAEERTVGDPLINWPVSLADISSSSSATSTDLAGVYSLPGSSVDDVTTALASAWFAISDQAPVGPNEPEATFAANPGPGNDFLWTQDHATWPARDAFAHAQIVRSYVEERVPTLAWLPQQVPIAVNTEGQCNAFYFNGQMEFRQGGGGCVNFARVSDVVYHEYGHGTHDFSLQAGVFDGAISEGSSDFLSATIWDDAEVGLGSYGPGTHIREIATDKVWPDDVVGEVHADGLIWASALWDLREWMVADLGYDDGVAEAEAIFFGSLAGGPTLTDSFDEVLLADDDDGNLSNGTPNGCLLADIWDAHGIGPGALGYFNFQHTPLDEQPTAAGPYPVDAVFELGDPSCSDFDTSSVTLHWALDQAGPFVDVPMAWDGASGYSAEIPRQPYGSTVWYSLSAADGAAIDLFTSHGDDPEALYRFYVGDLLDVWCDDMELGDGTFVHGLGSPDPAPPAGDDWERGEPQGLPGDPANAWSGVNIWGTSLGDDEDGRYSPNTEQFLLLPDVDLSPWLDQGLRFRYRRFLTVEDGFYDHAFVHLAEQPIWENPATPEANNHFVDTEWTLHDFEIDELVPEDGMVGVAWTLITDPGLQMGGWNIDDVCFVVPTGLQEAYTVEDFDAADGQDGVSTLTWTQPFAELWAVAVVRNDDDFPQTFDDGVIVYLDTDPVFGEEVLHVDEGLQAGQTYYYTVFAADSEWSWQSLVVPGENADEAVVWIEPQGDDDDSAGDDDDSAGDDDDTADDDDDTADDDDDTADDDDDVADDDDIADDDDTAGDDDDTAADDDDTGDDDDAGVDDDDAGDGCEGGCSTGNAQGAAPGLILAGFLFVGRRRQRADASAGLDQGARAS